ncbi:glycosyltransferase family 4 protein [Paenibacillus sp. ATY16]|uniref:glycosyltransferase family 4 protein n=1 Tax=Paenibacillus sp. ATY16 TaxID=1759312 RepID=UPI00200C05E7|nr:glycosyltransferase family 4 protein [Paenibacillus sp. ATY16]MCK9862888.1 glycosyltransferase family 4 protein [Paenibacillus sp. ATY16]
MRILIACMWALPHAGGVNTYVNQLVKGLQGAGHEVDIFSSTPDAQGYYIPSRNLSIEKSRLAPLIAHQTELYLNQMLLDIDPWIKQAEVDRLCMEAAALYFGLNEYDVIHAQDIVSAHAIARVKPAHIPLVTTIHGCLTKEWFVKLKELGLTDQNINSPLWHYSSLREYLGATVSDVTISPSLWLKNELVNDFAVPEERVTVSHYGFDIAEFQNKMLREPKTVKPLAEKVFICPARFDIVKGHSTLIHALAKLKEVRSDWVCWLVGDGFLREELIQLTNQLGLSNHILFWGHREDVPEMMQQADFVVLPSMQDNQPFAIIEAQIAGKPVITSDAGGIPEMVTHLQNGLVSRLGDPEQLYSCLRTALEEPELLSVMAEQAKAWGHHHWSLSTMISRVLELYEFARSKHEEERLSFEAQFGEQAISMPEEERKWVSSRKRKRTARKTKKYRKKIRGLKR